MANASNAKMRRIARHALDRSIAAAGGMAALARLVQQVMDREGVTHVRCDVRHVWAWAKRGGQVSAQYARWVSMATGVHASDLRPDVFGARQ